MRNKFISEARIRNGEHEGDFILTQPCPQCGYPIGIVAGSKEAICSNCGFKDPCCE